MTINCQEARLQNALRERKKRCFIFRQGIRNVFFNKKHAIEFLRIVFFNMINSE